MRNSDGPHAYQTDFRMVYLFCFLLFITSFMFIMPSPASAQPADPCSGNYLSEHDKNDPPDLLIGKVCEVRAGGKYFYGNVNISAGGRLIFEDPQDSTPTDFWARSIIVENGGFLRAEGAYFPTTYGKHGAILTIHLYGRDQSRGDPARNPGMGAPCRTPETDTTGPCGIPMSVWRNNGKDELSLPGEVKDYFYRYGPLRGDEKCSDERKRKWGPDKGDRCDERANPKIPAGVKVGYFGYKVLAVSYGGAISLHGGLGGCQDKATTNNCVSTWGRLAKSIASGDGVAKGREFEVEGPYISKGDQIVVTTTDYLPGHSETFDVEDVTRDVSTGRETVRVKQAAQWPHNGTRYSLVNRLKAAGSQP
jgi:cell migration-inducing and hyaluronan-binding protein